MEPLEDVVHESLKQETVLQLYSDPFAAPRNEEKALVIRQWRAFLTRPVFHNESRLWRRQRDEFFASLRDTSGCVEERFEALLRLLQMTSARWFPHEIVLLSRLETNYGVPTPDSFARIYTMFANIQPLLHVSQIADIQILGCPSACAPNNLRTHILYRNHLLLETLRFQKDGQSRLVSWLIKVITGDEKQVPPALNKRITHMLAGMITPASRQSLDIDLLHDTAVRLVSQLHPCRILTSDEVTAALSQDLPAITSALNVMNDQALRYYAELCEVLEKHGDDAVTALRQSFGRRGELFETLAFTTDQRINTLIELLLPQLHSCQLILYRTDPNQTSYRLAVSPLFAEEIKRAAHITVQRR